MTDPTVDGWTLPEDLYAEPIVLHEDEDGDTVRLRAHNDGGQHTLAIFGGAAAASTYVTADDLLTIAARLTLVAHTINLPAHDPDAAEWVWVDRHGEQATVPSSKAAAERMATHHDIAYAEDAPHVVKHVSELGR